MPKNWNETQICRYVTETQGGDFLDLLLLPGLLEWPRSPQSLSPNCELVYLTVLSKLLHPFVPAITGLRAMDSNGQYLKIQRVVQIAFSCEAIGKYSLWTQVIAIALMSPMTDENIEQVWFRY